MRQNAMLNLDLRLSDRFMRLRQFLHCCPSYCARLLASARAPATTPAVPRSPLQPDAMLWADDNCQSPQSRRPPVCHTPAEPRSADHAPHDCSGPAAGGDACAWVFDQNFIANLGNVDGYQHRIGGYNICAGHGRSLQMGCEHSHSRETLAGHGSFEWRAPAAKSCAHHCCDCFRSFLP